MAVTLCSSALLPRMAKPETTVADVMHPVGPLTPKVYWVRRVAAIVLAVAVLIGMVWFLATRSSRSAAVSEAAVNRRRLPPRPP